MVVVSQPLLQFLGNDILLGVCIMQLTEAQFNRISDLLPRQKGNIRLDNLQVLNAILYVATSGCQWRALPQKYGKWNTVYTRMMRWSKAGILDRIFERLQREQIIRIHIEVATGEPTDEKPSLQCANILPKATPATLGSAAGAGRPKYIWVPRLGEALRLS